MKLDSLKDLYVEQLRDLYNAEKQLAEALPKMAERATSAELKRALTTHLEETRQHADRLERIFQNLNEKPTGETCEAMQGLIKEGNQVLKAKGDEATIDAAIIATGNRVEHYEIAGYGTVRAFARQLGREDDAKILQQILDEEEKTDRLLTEMAENMANPAAARRAE